MFNGKMKAVTLSFDDGVTQDIRFIEILNKYGLKGTFNLNSELLGKAGYLKYETKQASHNKVNPEDVKSIYSGHEVAAHTLTHPFLTTLEETEVETQVEQDRLRLSELVGYEVKGFAYPGGGVNFNRRVADIIRDKTGIKYARTIVASNNFELQEDLYVFKPTVKITEDFDRLFELTQEFISLNPTSPALFYAWGHSYEYDFENTWDKIEEWCKLISGKADIFYGTNKEVFGIK